MLAAHDLGFAYRNDVIGVGPRSEFDGRLPEVPVGPPPLADRSVSLELRAVQVHEIVAALRALGIETFASERAWTSRGTTSIVLTGRLEDALRDLKRVGLRGWIALDPRAPSADIVLIDEEIPGADTALVAALPAVPSLVRKIEEERRALSDLIVARRAARSGVALSAAHVLDAETGAKNRVKRRRARERALDDFEPVFRAERAVADAAADVAHSIERAWRIARAPERVRDLEAALADAVRASSAAAEPHLRRVAQRRVQLLEGELATARKHVERLSRPDDEPLAPTSEPH